MELHIFNNGKALYYIANIIQSNREGVVTSGSLPAKEYKRLIVNHHDEVVYKEKGLKYWANKSNRILVNNPEVHFHKPLRWFLGQKVINGKVDSGATISGTDDRTDIRIIEFDTGNIYIIEIKCLGKTEKSSREKSDDWANTGLVQLNLYLNGEKFAKEGLLVLYDGRKDKQNVKFNWSNSIKWHFGLDRSPLQFYLESKSASVKAKKIYAKVKREKKK